MKPTSLLVASLLLLAVGAGVCHRGEAQEAAGAPSGGAEAVPTSDPPASQEIFGEAIQVNVVNVLVHVTDNEGRPVDDLTVEDFEIREDRRPVAITNFLAVSEGNRRGNSTPGAAVDSPPPAFVPIDQVREIPENERLRLVVLVDNFNIRPLERKRVVSRLQHFLLTGLGPQDQVMIATFDRSLHIRHPFTSDPRRVLSALDDLSELQGEAGRYDSERSRLLEDLQEAEDPELALTFLLPYADQVLHDLNDTVDGIETMIGDLGGLPGRKALLYVSSGLPMVAAADLFQAVDYQFPHSSATRHLFSYDASRRFDRLGELANANDVVFYTLDAGGLRPNQSGVAEQRGLDEARISLNIESDRQANLQMPLQFMAQVTGGRAILNQNDILPALEDVAADFHSYYSLGYQPSHYGDGQLHKIKVKVNRRGVKVRHREVYQDKSTLVRMEEGTMAALLHGFEENPMKIELVFGQGTDRQGGQVVVPVEVRIPVANIALVPQGDKSVAQLRLYIAAMNSDGEVSAVQERPLGIKIATDQVEAARKEFWIYPHRLRMRVGPQRLAIGVRDELGGETGFLSRAIDVR